MLLAALPGAILICIFHCSLALFAQTSGIPSQYLCEHMVQTGADIPPPVSAGLVQTLIQGVMAESPLVSSTLSPQPQALITAPVSPQNRLAESPPTPPPR